MCDKITKITLGTVQLGMNYGIANKTGKPSLETSFELLKRAYEGGIRSYDTSRHYGDSEIVLGKYFKKKENLDKKPIFCTKFKLDNIGEPDDYIIERTMFEFCEMSINRLGVKKLPIVLLHNPLDLTRYGVIVERTFRKLIKRGYINKAGASVYTKEQALKMIESDVYKAIQFPMNVFDLRFLRNNTLQKLKENDVTVFVRSIFLQGIFFLDQKRLPDQFAFTAKYVKKLKEFSEKIDMDIAKLVFSFVRDIKGVDSLVLGAETPKQVSENVKLINAPVLSESIRDEMEKLFINVPIEKIMKEIISIK